MDYYAYPIAPLLLGLASGLHCLGMCGGIIGAMALNLPEPSQRRGGAWPFLAAANLGRLVSYALAGGVMAGFGQALLFALSPRYGHLILQGAASLALILTGVYLLGWFPAMRRMEGLGIPLWRRLEPWGRRFITPRTPFHAFLFGLAWGWLPCSLVYSVLLWSASWPPWEAAGLMLLFGLGTLPATLPAGWLVQRLGGFTRLPQVKAILAVSLILTGAAAFVLTALPRHHDHGAPGLPGAPAQADHSPAHADHPPAHADHSPPPEEHAGHGVKLLDSQ